MVSVYYCYSHFNVYFFTVADILYFSFPSEELKLREINRHQNKEGNI